MNHLKYFFYESTNFNEEKFDTYIYDAEERFKFIYGNKLPYYFENSLNSLTFVGSKRIQSLYFSEQRKTELFIALAIIIDTGVEPFYTNISKVADRSTDLEFANLLIQNISERYTLFKLAAMELPGFKNFMRIKII